MVSKRWIQAAALVAVFGFFVMGVLAFRTYTAGPPVPRLVVSESGQELYTGYDVADGQKVFLANGLMQYGSVLGLGGYLGPDYTADYCSSGSRTSVFYQRNRIRQFSPFWVDVILPGASRPVSGAAGNIVTDPFQKRSRTSTSAQ